MPKPTLGQKLEVHGFGFRVSRFGVQGFRGLGV